MHYKSCSVNSSYLTSSYFVVFGFESWSPVAKTDHDAILNLYCPCFYLPICATQIHQPCHQALQEGKKLP